jgi:hypothetical protein
MAQTQSRTSKCSTEALASPLSLQAKPADSSLGGVSQHIWDKKQAFYLLSFVNKNSTWGIFSGIDVYIYIIHIHIYVHIYDIYNSSTGEIPKDNTSHLKAKPSRYSDFFHCRFL